VVAATRRLESLARDFPQRPQVHERLADLLVRQGMWTRAVEALRVAIAAVPDLEFQVRATARVAALAEEQLGQTAQAIAAWKEVQARRPDDPDALAQLQRLYLKTEQYGPLLPIVDQRLALVGPGDRDRRIALLVVKARALQEGLGDEAAAMATLETLAAEAPENDDVVLGLSRLVRRSGRLEEGLDLLRRRLDEALAAARPSAPSSRPGEDLADRTGLEGPGPEYLSEEPDDVHLDDEADPSAELGFEPLPADPYAPLPAEHDSRSAARILKIAGALADALEHEAADPGAALAAIDAALAAVPNREEGPPQPGRTALVARKVALARARRDTAGLIEGLALLGLPDGLLEAAGLARQTLGDRELAAQLYTRVLASRVPGDPQQPRRLSAAIEGLVRLRIEAGDIDGADALMDAQLAELADTNLRARILTEIGRTLLASLDHAPAAEAEPEPLTEPSEITGEFAAGEPEPTGEFQIPAEPTREYEVPAETTAQYQSEAPAEPAPAGPIEATPDAEIEATPDAEIEELSDVETLDEAEPAELLEDDDDEPITGRPDAPTPRSAPPPRAKPVAAQPLAAQPLAAQPLAASPAQPLAASPAKPLAPRPAASRLDARVATLQAARRRFEAALAADPDHAPARLSLGTVLFELGLYAEAEPVLEGVVEAFGLLRDQDNLIRGLVLLARLFEQTDRGNEAYRRLTMALRHDPDNLDIRAAIARNRHAAGRFRDTLAAIDPIEQRLDAGLELRPGQAELVSDLLLLAAECDLQLKQPERVAARYERAAALHPRSRKARAALATLCQESGRLAEAAEHTRALADQGDDRIERGRTFLRAGMLYHEAAGVAPDAGEESESGPGLALRTAAFECVQAGLALIADHPTPVLDRRQLEAAFWTAAPRNVAIALACLDRLLLRSDLKPEKKHLLLLEGARITLERGQEGDQARALAFARAAHEALPEAAAGPHAIFDVLAGQPGAHGPIETLVLGFFNRIGRLPRAATPDAAAIREGLERQRLLTRLAELQQEHPERAVKLLERAAELDPQGLDLTARRSLARLYALAAAAGTSPPNSAQVRINDEALILLDPLDERGLASLARHCVDTGERDRAHALYQVLRVVQPAHPDAAAFLGKNDLGQVSNGKLDVAAATPRPPAGGGVVAAMTQLWEGAAELLCDELPKLDISAAAWIEADSDRDTLLWKVWSELGLQLSTQGVRLADAAMIPGVDAGDGWTHVRAAHPPVVIVGPSARAADTAPRLRFVLGRALFGCRAPAALVTGLPRPLASAVLSAALQAFHPRHIRRTRVKDDADLATRLAQTFARKLPIRLARQLSALFKEHEHEGFDSRDWRAWAHRSGQRVGLCLARNIGVGLDILGLPQDPGERSQQLKLRAEQDPDLRDLLVFATSPGYVAARKTLGFEVRGR
jgi:Tfp pilus assembly protein PilF